MTRSTARGAARTRSYDEGCATAHALDLVGERWALLIVRELLFGPKRFTDLDARLIGASTSVLTQRLQELQDAGVVTRRKLPPPASSWVYELTEWGHELRPIVVALGRWGSLSPTFQPELHVTPAAMALAVEGFFDPAKANGLGLVELELDEERFHAAMRDGRLQITGPTTDHPVARIVARPEDIGPFLRGKRVTAKALKDGGVRIEGDSKTAVELLSALTA